MTNALTYRRLLGLLAALTAAGIVACVSAGQGATGKARGVRVPSPQDGILLAVGTEVQNAPAGDPNVFEVRVGNQSRKYRRLVEGDKVSEGQVLAQLNDQRARDQVASQKAKLVAARADFEAARAISKEAQARLDRLGEIKPRIRVSAEEYAGAVLTRDKHREEVFATKQAVRLAELELARAQLLLDLHTIRSPVNGVIQRIRVRPGQAVRKLETLFEIRGTEPE
jgi:multidrug efflux pump subunit AcrA (membrane-fusion protein)